MQSHHQPRESTLIASSIKMICLGKIGVENAINTSLKSQLKSELREREHRENVIKSVFKRVKLYAF